jgi:hypothetical protein
VNVQKRQMCSMGDRPIKGRVRTLVARAACVEETKRVKSVRQNHPLGMVSESLGCNESERTGDLETLNPRGRTHTEGVKATWIVAN